MKMESNNTNIEMTNLMPVVPVVCFCALYAAYYLFYVVKRPIIACRDASFRRFLDRHVPISKEKFWPTWWCFESRFQTVFRAILQSSVEVHYDSEFIKTPDGGEIQLDWSYNNACTTFPEESRPTILLMPGLTGNSKENYILNMVKDASELGYRCVVFINRGLGKSKLKTPRTYCATNVEDTEVVLDYIKSRFPQAPLMGTGISLGGMILLNYLAKAGVGAKVEAAMVVSVGWNVFAAVDSLSTPINYYLFNRTLASSLCYLVKHVGPALRGGFFSGASQAGCDIPDVDRHNMDHYIDEISSIGVERVNCPEKTPGPLRPKSKTIQDFDERFTAKVFGYSCVNDYYSAASPDFKIPHIAKPVLCLSAADDPFQPQHAIPLNKAQESDNVAIVMTSHGGHIGFMEGTFPRNHNYMNRWFKQYAQAMFSHGHKDL